MIDHVQNRDDRMRGKANKPNFVRIMWTPMYWMKTTLSMLQ